MDASSMASAAVSIFLLATFLSVWGAPVVTFISLLTLLTPSTSMAYSVVRSFCAMLSALPRKVITPSFARTSVPIPSTLLWKKRVVFTLVTSQASDFAAGAPFSSSLLSMVLTPGNPKTVSPAKSLWEALLTVPVKVTPPSFECNLMASFLR